jgi:hypothetical protein
MPELRSTKRTLRSSAELGASIRMCNAVVPPALGALSLALWAEHVQNLDTS